MKKFVLFVVFLVVGVKYGSEYLFSPKFQDYANKSKAPWTCSLENFIGHMCMIMSEYEKAQLYFNHTLARCPETEMAETAEYEIAVAYEKRGEYKAAARAYDAFAAKYKNSPRAKLAIRASQVISAS